MSEPEAAPVGPAGHARIIGSMVLLFAAMVTLSVLPIRRAPLPMPVYLEASPYGYTWSLSLSLLPLAVLLGWFWRVRDRHRVEWRAFGYTALLVFGIWTTLDILLANTLFRFPYAGATLPLDIPGLHFHPLRFELDIPVEELVFYLSTVLVMVLLYVWSSAVWFPARPDAEYREAGLGLKRAVQMNRSRVKLGYALAGFGVLWAYKAFGWHPYREGFPLYAAFLILGLLAPTLVFWETVKGFVNQRALLFTMMTVVLISLLWEVTLGIAYNWWGYRMEMMVGITIRPWFDLPVEAAFLWVMAGWSNVTLFEVLKLRAASGRRTDEFLTGRELRLRRRRGAGDA